MASYYGHTAIVQALLRAGAQLSEPDIRAMKGPQLSIVLGLLGKVKKGRVGEQKDRLVKALEDGTLASFANSHPEAVALQEAVQQGGGAGRATAGGSAAAAGAAAAAAASSSSAGGGGAGASKRARTASKQGELDKQLYDAADSSNDKSAEITRLLAAGADPNGHKNPVRGCARATSLPAAPAPSSACILAVCPLWVATMRVV